ncbi:Major capsid protein L1 [Bienertia sinuspersici]
MKNEEEEPIKWVDDGAHEEGQDWYWPRHGLDISNIGTNTFLFQLYHWLDKERVMESQPWHFDGNALFLGEVQGSVKPSDIQLHELPIWTRMYDLPFKGGMHDDNVKAHGTKDCDVYTAVEKAELPYGLKGCIIREEEGENGSNEMPLKDNEGSKSTQNKSKDTNQNVENDLPIQYFTFNAGTGDFKVSNTTKPKREGRKRKGGLTILWSDVVKINVRTFSQNHIDVMVDALGEDEWRFTGVYGCPENENEHLTGNLLEKLQDSDCAPWLCGGDFNLMMTSVEKKGGDGFDEHLADFEEICRKLEEASVTEVQEARLGWRKCTGINEADKSGFKVETRIQSFFHQKENQRAQRNNVHFIKQEGGNVYEKQEQIMEVFAYYFETFFATTGEVEVESHGDFTVRSAYFEELKKQYQTAASISNEDHSGVWLRLGKESEIVTHMLLGCSKAKMIWYLSPLRLDGDQAQCGSVRDWVQDKLKTIVDIRWRSLFWSLAAWSIWLRRNKWIYEGKKLDLNVVIQRAIGSSNEFDEAFKDHQGDVVAATCQTMCGEFEVKVAEALAVWHTLGIEHLKLGLGM